ncbi:hypothetical protein F5B22DRAFT_70597 [Xylaria bambusicola]|uniref:uncharacterized protein n=1 Tax=Xylaria bambusicola TaxID=326684 RepID=UPI0020082D98|nr:uncharacterized protein F5B22DRAFT_70597 [Xylaria bambusicola]KAI0518556.1 hypothetical protein F5B22DRAFT_70597 [Xylaria bambusicola]
MDHSQPAQHTTADSDTVTSPPLARSPLSNRSNVNTHTNNSIWDHKDSSEDRPSTHDSVCDAAWLSTSDVAKSPYQTPGRPVTPLQPVEIDINSESPLSRLETPFLYGYGTELTPILERRSIATLRTKGSLSTSDLSSLLHDAPGAKSKGENPTHSLELHRQQPFKTEESQQNESGSPQLRWLSYSRPTIHVVDIHAYPRKPIYPPPQRPLTPPTIRKVRRPQSEGDAYVASTSSGIAYAAPAFKAPRSGHGNLSNHPFVRQAQLPSQPRSTFSAQRTRAECAPPPPPSSSARYIARSNMRSSTASPGLDYLAPPEARGEICKRCRHPCREPWSLRSTLVGHGPGVRRGADWCGRCAVRKVVRAWCCGELGL